MEKSVAQILEKSLQNVSDSVSASSFRCAARCVRHALSTDHPIVAMKNVAETFERWADEYEAKSTARTGGTA